MRALLPHFLPVGHWQASNTMPVMNAAADSGGGGMIDVDPAVLTTIAGLLDDTGAALFGHVHGACRYRDGYARHGGRRSFGPHR
jgi:hypothetical protein